MDLLVANTLETLLLRLDRGRLHVTLNRPQARNAMSLAMVRELTEVLAAVDRRADVRTLVLRGAAGHFCAGADVRDMAAARAARPGPDGRDPLADANRAFGDLISRVDRAPQAVVAVLEGSVLGGGLGLACVADVSLALASASFGLPETSLGVPPAQIAPFLLRRLGLGQARRLAVTGGRFDGVEAARMGLAHEVHHDGAALETALERVLSQIDKCAPGAVAATKRIMLAAVGAGTPALLDEAARLFATAARGPEGEEGVLAFLEQRLPSWAKEDPR